MLGDHSSEGDPIVLVRRLRATLLGEPPHGNAHLAGLIGEVVLDAGAGEHHDPDGEDFEHLIIALEGCGLGVFRPVGLEGGLEIVLFDRAGVRVARRSLRIVT